MDDSAGSFTTTSFIRGKISVIPTKSESNCVIDPKGKQN